MNRFLKMTCRSLPFLALGLSVAQAQQATLAPRADGSDTPIVAYEPAESKSCPPLAVLSPGLGSNEKDLAYLGKSLSDDGWLAIVMGHKESGRAYMRSSIMSNGLKAGILDAITHKEPYDARLMDIAATLKWADSRCHAPFKAMLGHSMGAATVMMEAGAHNKLGVEGGNRFDAYVALSPQGPGSIFTDDAWRDIRKPVLVMTGTRDSGTEGTWQWRTETYKRMSAGCKWLGVVDGANHLNFAETTFSSGVHTLVSKTAVRFLDGVRSGRCAAPNAESGETLDAK